MNAIDFTNAILSPKPTNYLTNDSVQTRTQASTGYNACLHFFWTEIYLQVFVSRRVRRRDDLPKTQLLQNFPWMSTQLTIPHIQILPLDSEIDNFQLKAMSKHYSFLQKLHLCPESSGADLLFFSAQYSVGTYPKTGAEREPCLGVLLVESEYHLQLCSS